MPAFTSVELDPTPLSRPAAQVSVYRYSPNGSPTYELLSNIKVLGIRYREGADPGIARFRYVFDPMNPPTDPVHFQDVLSTDSDLPGVVRNDDRLVVFATNADGSPQALFDGFAQVPELDLSPTTELVTFLAYGAAIRAWDMPIGGALMRHADTPTTVADVTTNLETHFNPEGEPNATPSGADAVDGYGNTYPTFLDPLVVRPADIRRPWTLPMAARYLCFHHNPDQAYIKNPDGSLLDSLLDSRSPNSNALFQPDDPTTYGSQPILVPDYPATGKAWPTVLSELLEPNGFGMAFRLDTDATGNPFTSLDIFRRQGGTSSTYKDLYLQNYGSTLEPGQTNLGAAHLARDISGVANSFTVESSLIRYEASFVLAPGFAVASSDAVDGNALSAYDRNNPNFSKNVDKYRLYVFDETGEGHWDFGSGATLTTTPSLAALFFDPTSNRPVPYVRRRRIPLGELFTLDQAQRPLKAQLSISTNYSGTQPGLWDGSGTWQVVTGGFELLKDRLGIWINSTNPNGWNVGASKASGTPYPAGIVKGVEDQANSGGARFRLRLTCVIEGDQTIAATAGRRASSPTQYTVNRWVDASDRYVKHIKAASSEFNATSSAVVVQDDGPSALADANARRSAGEAGEVAGTVTIPRFTSAYAIGDKVCSIQGRNLSLQTNAGTPASEAPVFPAVVGISWEFDGRQQTILQLSDQRSGVR